MKNNLVFLLLFFLNTLLIQAQNEELDESDYFEFNDRKSVVHGVYLSLTAHYGEIDEKDTYQGGLKLAYVANQQIEVGLSGQFFYSDQNFTNTALNDNEDLIGAYLGLHVEPILFSKSRVNLSFPVLIGAGAVGYLDGDVKEDTFDQEVEEAFENYKANEFFVIEPGVSALFNLSRYVQLEAGIKYRLTSKLDFNPNRVKNINGFSFGLGIKLGVFNMGRNRYKKNIQDEE